ncbi:MAG: helix-turn-helix domain-containing protein [Bacteroidales bacterium]|nr:helix-turn-helix domain-containing protein [Bacteroidales bacterium]
MTDRIELILKTQNLTPTQFADAIGIQRSSMSHILARRNKPSLDFVMKLLNRFPEINAEWLLTGKSQMFDIGTSAPTLPSGQTAQVGSKTPEFEWEEQAVSDTCTEHGRSAYVRDKSSSATDYKPAPAEHDKIQPASKPDLNHNSDIERIIVFFTDGTFRSYS